MRPEPSPPQVSVRVDGVAACVAAGASVAAALAQLGLRATRRALDGAPRAAFCGMGVCFECRVRVDGRERLGCLVRVAEGMEIDTRG
jgi:hypothetical protein